MCEISFGRLNDGIDQRECADRHGLSCTRRSAVEGRVGCNCESLRVGCVKVLAQRAVQPSSVDISCV